MTTRMASRQYHHTADPGVPELESEWDVPFHHLEAVRTSETRGGKSSCNVAGDLSGYFTNSELVTLNSLRETDDSMNELREAVRKMNRENGTDMTVDDVLGRVRDVYLSG